MNTQRTMNSFNGQIWYKLESIPEDMFVNETLEQYLTRIGAKNNSEKKEEFSRFDRDD